MRPRRFTTPILLISLATLATASIPMPSLATQTRAPARSAFEISSRGFGAGGWRWHLDAALGLSSTLSLTIRASQTLQDASHPQQLHEWRFTLPAQDLSVDHADLMPARLDTGTDLGHFGTIDVSLQPGTTLRSRAVTCPSTEQVTQRIHWRSGTFDGSFDFKPGTGFPADVAPSSFHGTVRKRYDTGTVCSSDGGGGGCPVDTTISAFRAGDDQRGTLFAEDRPDGSSIYFDDIGYARRKTVMMIHSMLAAVPAGAVVVSGGNAVMHSKPFGSWADGTIRLTLGPAHVRHISPTCVRTFYEVATQAGGITVHLASGDVHYATPFPHGIGVVVVQGS